MRSVSPVQSKPLLSYFRSFRRKKPTGWGKEALVKVLAKDGGGESRGPRGSPDGMRGVTSQESSQG